MTITTMIVMVVVHSLCVRTTQFWTFICFPQGFFFNTFFLAYIISPRTAHAFVGYLEEEAVKTYTHALDAVETGKIPGWTNLPAPEISKAYWLLKVGAILCWQLIGMYELNNYIMLHSNCVYDHTDSRDIHPSLFEKGPMFMTMTWSEISQIWDITARMFRIWNKSMMWVIVTCHTGRCHDEGAITGSACWRG